MPDRRPKFAIREIDRTLSALSGPLQRNIELIAEMTV